MDFRHAADFFQFGGGEFATTTTAAEVAPNSSVPENPDGALFYRKTVAVGPSNTLYVSLYTTSDLHEGAAEHVEGRGTRRRHRTARGALRRSRPPIRLPSLASAREIRTI